MAGIGKKFAVLGATVGLLAVLVMSLVAAEAQRVDKDTLKGWLGKPDVLVIDVRRSQDWEGSTVKIKGAVRQDPGKSAIWGKDLPKDKTIVLYCAWPNEGTSARVAQELTAKGYGKVYALKGGWKEWEKAKYPTEAK